MTKLKENISQTLIEMWKKDYLDRDFLNGDDFSNLLGDILELQTISKKKVLDVYISKSFVTYTRHSGVVAKK